ncbi:WXG100 family type VII secretion target [Nonomuraea rhizosphaerae]|uniref:WXG100 family type VII secretion target n=1 Tax=Nonomuraea rhizosphaerae TaxID=2665663 RepID=UPI001C5E38AC|nr:hypothetical protein [Nonomuraea rhizosphaerae]
MAETKGGRNVVVILDFSKMPQGETVYASKDEILKMLNDAQLTRIQDAGFAYDKAAGAIELAVNALEEHAPKIATAWTGPDATKARHALQMLHASGGELATKLEMMSSALRQYAGFLPETIAEVNGYKSNMVSSDGDQEALRKADEEIKARDAMKKLNEKIVQLYNIQLPHDVSYELPPVSLPGGTGSYEDPDYRDPVNVSYNSGASGGDYSGGYNSSNGTGTGSSSSGTGTGTGTGTGDPNGSEGGPGSDTGDGPGSGTDDQPGGGQPGDGTTDPGGSNGDGTQDQSQNGAQDNKDGTVPPVLGADDKTSTDVPKGADPNATEVSAYTPTTATTTPVISPTGNPVSTIAPNPVGVLSPTGGPPGVPSVLGSPNGAFAAREGGLMAGARGTAIGVGGMPFMPMGGMGGAGESGDFERTTFLPADKDDWDSAHDVTNPVIC